MHLNYWELWTKQSELSSIHPSCLTHHCLFHLLPSIRSRLTKVYKYKRTKNKSYKCFSHLQALMFSSLCSLPERNMMKQHRGSICHSPLSLPCWYSDTSCQLLDCPSVTPVKMKLLDNPIPLLDKKKSPLLQKWLLWKIQKNALNL